jgi:hypothetical protein
MALHGQRPFVQVILNGHPATFLIDTGTASTIVDSDTPEEGPSADTITLQIGDLRFPRLQAAREGVRAYAETNLGGGADGVIGQDLFAHYPIALDFPNRTLTIYRDSRTATAAEQPGAVTTAMRMLDRRPAIQGSLDGQPPLWFAISTGAGFEVQLDPSVDHASRYARAEHSLPYHETTINGDTSGKLVRAHALAIASLTFNQPLVALLDSRHAGVQSELSGMLGATMLARLSVLIDEPLAKAVIAAPPSATWAPPYNPSGISLAMRRGTIVVRAVAPGTPAEESRLHPGDEIVSINGLAPATLDFARQLLEGGPGTRLTIAYRRWRIVHFASLTLRILI